MYPDPTQGEHPCGIFFFIIYGPLFGVVCAFGVIGNSLSFAVLHKYSRNSVANYLLKGLAISDNMFLVTGSFAQMYLAMSMFFGLQSQLEPIFPYIQTYAWPLVHLSQMGTVWMTVLIASNRYIAVCKPLHAPRLCRKRNVQMQTWGMCFCLIIYNIPRCFEYSYVQSNVTLADNTTEVQDENVGLASFQVYNIMYENISYCLFVFLIPLLILVVLNVHLVRDLKAAQKCRKTISSRSTMEENNITLVMIVIIIVFMVCQTPASINQILYYIIQDREDTCSVYARFYHVSNLLTVTNSSVNFIIYCLFRRQFQQELCVLLSCKKRRTHHGLRRTVILRALHERSSTLLKKDHLENVPLQENSTVDTSVNSNQNHTVRHQMGSAQDLLNDWEKGNRSLATPRDTNTELLHDCETGERSLKPRGLTYLLKDMGNAQDEWLKKGRSLIEIRTAEWLKRGGGGLNSLKKQDPRDKEMK